MRFPAVVQNALPPYTMRCLDCGLEWNPTRTTDSGLEREARDHLRDCPGWVPLGGMGDPAESPSQ